jgi:hypothetical protein
MNPNSIESITAALDTAHAPVGVTSDVVGTVEFTIPTRIAWLANEREEAEAKIVNLQGMIERLCDELEGTHEHIQDILDGNVTGTTDPQAIFGQLRKDLPRLREMDEKVIAKARVMIGEAHNG